MSDFSTAEMDRARAALRFLHARTGKWEPLAKALRASVVTLSTVSAGSRPMSASLVVRIAKLAGVGVDDVIGGRFPPKGACPHCGHIKSEPAQ